MGSASLREIDVKNIKSTISAENSVARELGDRRPNFL